MNNILALSEKIEQVLIQGDLAPLTPAERVAYYNKVCASLGLNSLTKPLEYVKLNNKLTLYARKDATDQLRRIYKVSIDQMDVKQIGDIVVVTVAASTPDARKDQATGVVNVAGLRGEALANAMMKAETKAKRRVTLSICGLGLLDETEAEPIVERELEVAEANERFEDKPKELPQAAPQETIATLCVARIDFKDVETRQKVKAAGFQWNKEQKQWEKAFDADEIENYDFEFEIV